MSRELTLSSLAMLKVSIDRGGDYIEYLRPFVLEALSTNQTEPVNDDTVAKLLRITSGLEIPRRTIQIVLRRIAKAGYLKKDQGTYERIKELPVVDFRSQKASAARKISAVSKSLIAFASESAKREIDDDQAMEAIVAFLARFSIPCLKAFLRGTALPTVDGNSDWQVVLVSQYLNGLLDTHPGDFDDFMVLVQGHMLANALLCPDLESVTQSYKNVIFYFDSRLLIQFLGLEGDAEKQAVEEVVRLVQKLDGKIAYFSHTGEELVNVVKRSAEFIDSPAGRGTIVEEARKAGRTKSDLILVADKAPDLLADAAIVLEPTPPYDPKTFKFEIGEELFSNILDSEIRYNNPKARDYDMRSVRSVYILRKGLNPFSIEKCRAVLVTSNTAFCNAAYIYGKNIDQSREVSAVITDFSLANTAWLKAPQGAPSLPRKEVLAFAYATMRPSDDFWDKVLAEAEKLEATGSISARDHQLLRSDYHVQEELMKLTLGEDDSLSDVSITESLRRVSEEIKSEEQQKLHDSEQLRHDVELRLQQQLDESDVVKKRVYWRCDRRALTEARILSGGVWLGQGTVAIVGLEKLVTHGEIGWILIIAAILSGLIRMAGTIWDLKPFKLLARYRDWRRSTLLEHEYTELGIAE